MRLFQTMPSSPWEYKTANSSADVAVITCHLCRCVITCVWFMQLIGVGRGVCGCHIPEFHS
jgi:hypothetical protein